MGTVKRFGFSLVAIPWTAVSGLAGPASAGPPGRPGACACRSSPRPGACGAPRTGCLHPSPATAAPASAPAAQGEGKERCAN